MSWVQPKTLERETKTSTFFYIFSKLQYINNYFPKLQYLSKFPDNSNVLLFNFDFILQEFEKWF